MNKIFLHIIFVFLLFASCKQELGIKEYVHWVENPENGLVQQKEIDGLLYILQYKPVDYIVAKESLNGSNFSAADFQKRKETLKGAEYYALKIRRKDSEEDVLTYNMSDENEYYHRTNYCSFQMAKDIMLYNGKDTLHPNLFQHVPTYGISPFAEFMIAFDEVKNDKAERKFIFNNNLFYSGTLLIGVSESSIEKIPNIIIQ